MREREVRKRGETREEEREERSWRGKEIKGDWRKEEREDTGKRKERRGRIRREGREGDRG